MLLLKNEDGANMFAGRSGRNYNLCGLPKKKKKYNNEKLIVASLRRESKTPTSPPRPTRSSTVSLLFDFNNTCFFCEESVTEESRQRQNKLPVENRNPMVKVMLPEVANTILSYARQRGDEWGTKIRDHICILEGMNTDLVW